MTFDPFGDFETRGYLQNHVAEKDLDIIKRLEHSSFTTGIDEAFKQLAASKELTYEHVLDIHKTLFDAVYHWAGQDRTKTAPDIAVVKGDVLFAHPADIRGAIEFALKNGQDKEFMTSKPGEVMGYLAYGHPFLDGNGRTIMVVHSVLAQRAGFSIDWAATSKTDYLDALTKELDRPGKGLLDAYLKPFTRSAVEHDRLADGVAGAPGLDGNAEANRVLGKTSEPAVQARYEQQQLKRSQSKE